MATPKKGTSIQCDFPMVFFMCMYNVHTIPEQQSHFFTFTIGPQGKIPKLIMASFLRQKRRRKLGQQHNDYSSVRKQYSSICSTIASSSLAVWVLGILRSPLSFSLSKSREALVNIKSLLKANGSISLGPWPSRSRSSPPSHLSSSGKEEGGFCRKSSLATARGLNANDCCCPHYSKEPRLLDNQISCWRTTLSVSNSALFESLWSVGAYCGHNV